MFDLEQCLTDCLSVECNSLAPLRVMYPRPMADPYLRLAEGDPLEALGEGQWCAAPPAAARGSTVQEYYRGAHVLITGATGFIGKVLIEKLLRSMPYLSHVHLLIRRKKGKSADERLDTLLKDKLFNRLKTEVPDYRKKITAIEGDLTQDGLGLAERDRQTLTEMINVVFNSAANVRFLETLKTAVDSNVLGTKRVMELAREMKSLKSFVHVSTAYSQCVRRVVEERVPRSSQGHEHILRTVEGLTEAELERETPRLLQGWPNTYAFSKAVCEEMIDVDGVDLPICIFRPSVVFNTYREPVRGWTDNLSGPVGLLVGAALGMLHAWRIDPEMPTDLVPVDFTVNAAIAAAAAVVAHRDPSRPTPVYNFVSTPLRPMKWKTVKTCGETFSDIWNFKKQIWYTSFLSCESEWAFQLAHMILHKLPGAVLDNIGQAVGQKPRLTKIYKTLDKLSPQISYFAFNIWEFKNDNVVWLWNNLSDEDKQLFNFDLREVDMAEHFLISKLGTRYYFMKDGMDTIAAAERKSRWLYWLHVGVKMAVSMAALKMAVVFARTLPF